MICLFVLVGVVCVEAELKFEKKRERCLRCWVRLTIICKVNSVLGFMVLIPRTTSRFVRPYSNSTILTSSHTRKQMSEVAYVKKPQLCPSHSSLSGKLKWCLDSHFRILWNIFVSSTEGGTVQ